ncbi:putative metal-dependent phosphotriesterase family hydrolase [Bradyrhizobium sp. GM0.4]
MLFASGGVAARHCLIGHSCWNADPAYHRRIVDAGSYVGFDTIGWTGTRPDWIRADNLAKLVRDGFRAQIMMSQDRYCGWLGKLLRPLRVEELAKIEHMMSPPFTYLFTDFIPMLQARGIGEADIKSILEDNPRRFFAGEALPPPLAKVTNSPGGSSCGPI